MSDSNEWSFGSDEEMAELKKLNAEVVSVLIRPLSSCIPALNARSSRTPTNSKPGRSLYELPSPSKAA